MHPRAERIVAHFQEKIATLNLENGSAGDAKPQEKMIAEHMFNFIRRMQARKSEDSGHSSDQTLSEDYDMFGDDWPEYTDDDSYFETGTTEDKASWADLMYPEDEISQKAEKQQDLDERTAEIKRLRAQLERLGDTQYSVMKDDMVMDREMKVYLDHCESQRRKREKLLNDINEQRKQIYSLILILNESLTQMLTAHRPEQKPTSSGVEPPTPAKTWTQIVEARRNLIGARKIETPAVAPAVPNDLAKTSTPSQMHREVEAATDLMGACKTEKSPSASPAVTDDFLDDADVDLLDETDVDLLDDTDVYSEMTYDSLPASSNPRDSDYPKLPITPQQTAEPAQPRNFEHLSPGQPQQRPSEQALPKSTTLPSPHQYAQGSFYDPVEACRKWSAVLQPYPQGVFGSLPTPAPQQPYSPYSLLHHTHYSSYYPSNGFGVQKPQDLSGASVAPHGTYSSFGYRDLRGPSRWFSPLPDARGNPVPNPNPLTQRGYYGGVPYPF